MPLPNGAAIKAIREAKGWKGIRLAQAVGISRFHLSNIERDGKNASVEVLRKLADKLQVPLAAITGSDTVDEIAGDEEDDEDVCIACGAVA